MQPPQERRPDLCWGAAAERQEVLDQAEQLRTPLSRKVDRGAPDPELVPGVEEPVADGFAQVLRAKLRLDRYLEVPEHAVDDDVGVRAADLGSRRRGSAHLR